MSTNISSLDRAIQNAILWLKDIQDELKWDDKEKVYKATKATLQAMRDRLPIEEIVHLLANLPMVMKGMMMDSYDYQQKPVRMRTIEDFYSCVQDYYDAQRRDIINPETVTHAVIMTLQRRIGEGEISKIAANMPAELKSLFQIEAISP
jgi:uncharacterized protein (DUF2267 family)